MNGPPTRIARFRDLLVFAVMNLTTSWGWASTPIPTPRTSVVIMVSHMGDPNKGISVHPVIPVFVRASGTSGAIAVRLLLAAFTPPKSRYVATSRIVIPTSMIAPCTASVYITAISPPKMT